MDRFMGWILLLLLAERTAAQQGNMNVSVFRASATRARAEIYWQILPTVLHYQRVNTTDSLIAATYTTELRIYRDTTLVKTDRWVTRTPPVTPKNAAFVNLLDGYTQNLPVGSYRVELQCTEPLAPAESFTLTSAFQVDSPMLKMSPPQLLDTFYHISQPAKLFIRNGWLSLPLTVDFAGDDQRTLHYYVEAYELPALTGPKKPFRIQSTLLKGQAPFGRFQQTDTCSVQNGVAAAYISLPIAKLPSGNFILQTQLTDASGKIWASSRRAFQRSNAQPEADTIIGGADSVARGQKLDEYIRVENTFVQPYKPQQLKAMLKMIQPIAKPDEGVSIRALLQGADPTFIRTFIYSFFAARNPEDPESAWKKYADEVRTVNRLFNLGSRIGYETERGRVYLQYGPPTERVEVYQESGSRPYEVWRYDDVQHTGKSGSFLFFQPGTRLDDFLLLHSTAPGEAKNRVWRSGLYTNGPNERSRAETYFPERQ
ncbi:MAG: GWxTD domain-containing protein [Sphingobacteriales bacterium]|nr:MAG: GWxTD domain-containing protein [Sphingobacteriales bacterium]